MNDSTCPFPDSDSGDDSIIALIYIAEEQKNRRTIYEHIKTY